jgi:uncharacterized membrane protein YfcA
MSKKEIITILAALFVSVATTWATLKPDQYVWPVFVGLGIGAIAQAFVAWRAFLATPPDTGEDSG